MCQSKHHDLRTREQISDALLLLIQKTKGLFGRHKSLFGGYKRLWGDTINWVLTSSEVKGGLINCKIVIDILEGQTGKGGSSTRPKSSSSNKAAVKQQQQQKQR